jgi:hypothetical protein
METRLFLERVLPKNGGEYFGAAIGSNNKYLQEKLNSIAALEAYIESNNKKHLNVYFATGVYDNRREAKYTQFKKALYVDIDTGESKDYANKKDALKAVANFCKGFLQPSIIVDSGNGLHLYWVLDKPITLHEWTGLANSLRIACDRGDLHVDPTVTTDPARILRVPGSYNYKNANPKQARVIFSKPTEYNIAELRTALGTASAPSKLAGFVGEDDLSGGMDKQLNNEPRYAPAMMEKCEIFKASNADGGAEQAEPLWMYQLQLLAFCEDGREYIHTISDGHDKYDFSRTEKKYALQKRKVDEKLVGPIKCSTLGMYAPDKCAACQFNGHITTPLQLGKDISDLPHGWKQDDKAIYRVIVAENEDGTATHAWEKALPFTISDFEVHEYLGLEEKETYVQFIRTVASNPRKVKMQITDAFIRNPHSYANSKYGIPLNKEEGNNFRDLIVSFQKEMERSRNIKLMSNTFGWQERNNEEVFILPLGAANVRGTWDKVSFKDNTLSRWYTPHGTRQAWIDIAHPLTALDRHGINTAVLASFGAPLIRFTGVNSGLISIYSPESGTGKSTGILVGQSVWGDPVQGVNSLQDTPNSVIAKLGHITNLPAYWDEVRLGRDPMTFLNMIFQLSQGKERSRLTADITQRGTGSWRTLFVVATNSSLRDHADALDANSTASNLRIFEVEAPPIDKCDALNIFPPALHNNYGHIGEEYAMWLVQNVDQVRGLVKRSMDMVGKKVGSLEDERFWLATCAVLITAAIVSTKLGYTKVNVKSYTEWLIQQYLSMRGVIRINSAPSTQGWDLLTEYVNNHNGQMVITERLTSKDVKEFGAILHKPTHPVIIGVQDSTHVRLSKKHFTDWLYERRMDKTSILKALGAAGVREVRAQYTGGVGIGGRVRCLEFDKPT